MAILRYARTPFCRPDDHELVELEPGPLAPQLLERWPDGPGHEFALYRGAVAPGCEVGFEDALELVVGAEDVFVMQGYPAGPVLVALPIISAVLSIAAAFIFKQDEPDLVVSVDEREQFERVQPGPNNRLQSRANEIRLGGRIPEVYGRVRVWPDVLVPAYTEYVEQEQYLTEWFAIGIGRYELEGARIGNTAIESLVGTTFTVLENGAIPTDVLEVRGNSEVRDLTLVNTNDAKESLVCTFPGASGEIRSTDPALYYSVDPGYLLSFTDTTNAGTYLVTDKGIDDAVSPAVYKVICAASFNALTDVTATYRIKSPAETIVRSVVFADDASGAVVANEITLSDYPASADPWLASRSTADDLYIVDPTGTSTGIYDVEQVTVGPPRNYLRCVGADFQPKRAESGVTFLATRPSEPANWSGWYELPIDDPLELWLDFEFPRGLYTEVAGSGRSNYTVFIDVEYRIVGDEAAPQTAQIAYTAAEVDPRRYTHKIDVSLVGSGRFEVRARKATQPPADTNTQVWVTEVEWTRASGVRPLPAITLGDISSVSLKSRATLLAASLQSRRYNVLATRKLPTWTEGGGWQPEATTRRMADALVHRAKADDGGRFEDSEIDLVGIYAIQAELDALDDGEAGHFDYSFDAVGSTDGELATIANACRCTVHRAGSALFIRRTDPVVAPVALYNRRNKSPEPEVRLMSYQQTTSADGVEIEYLDGEDGEFTSRTYREPPAALNPRRIKLSGAVNWRTVWRRAQHEWARLQYSRDRITVNVTDEGRLVTVGDVVASVDNIDLDELDGEIVGWDPVTLEVTIDRPVFIPDYPPYSITLRDQTGRLIDTVGCVNVFGVTLSGTQARGKFTTTITAAAVGQSATIDVNAFLPASPAGVRVLVAGADVNERLELSADLSTVTVHWLAGSVAIDVSSLELVPDARASLRIQTARTAAGATYTIQNLNTGTAASSTPDAGQWFGDVSALGPHVNDSSRALNATIVYVRIDNPTDGAILWEIDEELGTQSFPDPPGPNVIDWESGAWVRDPTLTALALARAPTIPLSTEDTSIRNLYRVGPDVTTEAQWYSVVSSQIGEPYVTLELENYAAEVFASDAEPPPPRPTI